jgi:hypothetical protein
MMEWISIEDKEPPKNGLAFLGYENGEVYIFNFRMGDWHECSKGEIAYEVKPSYWMPLPKPPGGEK